MRVKIAQKEYALLGLVSEPNRLTIRYEVTLPTSAIPIKYRLELSPGQNDPRLFVELPNSVRPSVLPPSEEIPNVLFLLARHATVTDAAQTFANG